MCTNVWLTKCAQMLSGTQQLRDTSCGLFGRSLPRLKVQKLDAHGRRVLGAAEQDGARLDVCAFFPYQAGPLSTT